MVFDKGDLVMVRVPDVPGPGRKRHYNVWVRVLFIDNDYTFIGKAERIDRGNFTRWGIGEVIPPLSLDEVQHVFQEGEQFCYGDGVSICDCKGLCRNK